MRKIGLAGICIVVLLCTGCMQKYDLSETNTDVAAEYMAGIMLAHDDKYTTSLLSTEEVKDKYTQSKDSKIDNVLEEKKTASTIDTKKTNNTDDKQSYNSNYTINEVLGTKNLEISYEGYDIYKEYPEDESLEYFTVTPREGYELLIAKFVVHNESKKNQKLDLKSSDIVYQLDVNVGTVYKPLFTLLENDLRYIDMSIKAGEKKTVLLIFEVSKKGKINDINLMISRGSKSEIIELK